MNAQIPRKKKYRMKYVFVSFILIWNVETLVAQSFSAHVSRNKIQVGEPFEVYFQVDNAQAKNIQYPDFKGLEILNGPNTAQSMRIINGQMSQSITYSFYLQALKEGSITIGSAKADINNKPMSTRPIDIQVLPAANAGTSKQNLSQGTTNEEGVSDDVLKQIRDQVFILSIPDKTRAYQGEQINVTYKLYTRPALADLSLSNNPAYQNFWVENLDVGDEQYAYEVYKGLQYRVVTIKKVALFPQRAGKLTIDPIELETVVQVRVQAPRRKGDIFEEFFNNDPFFGNYKNIPMKIKSISVDINVQPLPESGKPLDFNGVVGEFTLNSKLDKTETETGSPITWTISFAGTGNIKTLAQPSINFPPDFDVFDPKLQDNSSIRNGKVTGSRSYDYLIIPQNPGEFKLPQVNFSYFDLSKKRYITLNTPAYTLKVTGNPLSTTRSTASYNKGEIAVIGEDIQYIHTQEPSFQTKGKSFIFTPLFLSAYAAPWLLFALLMYYRKKQELLAADVAGVRSKKAVKEAKKRLEKAAQLMSKQDARGFYDEISRSVWGFIADKLNLNPSELSRDAVNEKLAGKKVTSDLQLRLISLVDTCEMALYAPSAITTNMNQTLQEAESLLIALDEQIQMG